MGSSLQQYTRDRVLPSSEYIFFKSQGVCYLFHLIYFLYFFHPHIVVGGSGFNHLIVMHLIAVASSICKIYLLALTSISFGNRPSRATIGSIVIFPSNTSLSVSNAFSKMYPVLGTKICGSDYQCMGHSFSSIYLSM